MRLNIRTFATCCALLLYLHMHVAAQIPAGSVPATPSTMYYAGGSCAFYSSTGALLMSVNAAEAQWSCSPARAAWAYVTPTSGGYYEFPSYTTEPMREERWKLLSSFFLPTNDTIYSEYVLLDGIGSTAPLLYQPRSIVRIDNYDGSVVYTVGSDVTVEGRMIKQQSARVSSTVSVAPGKRGNGSPNGLMNTSHTSWTRVTYVPDRSTWTVPESVFPPRTVHPLPGVEGILARREPLTIQAVGMSITSGHNVSGGLVDQRNFPPAAPYMRGYCELLADELHAQGRSAVTLHNSSCSGKTIEWAANYIVPLAVPNAPDLIILDMGMNDIWGQTTPAQFRRNAQRCIDSVRKHLPNTEFLLLANMIPDTAGAGAPRDGAAILRAFAAELRSLTTQRGVAMLDMTTLSEAVFARKGVESCLANALHPNDYFARWYAQALLAFIESPATSVDQVRDVTNLTVREDVDAVALSGLPAGCRGTMSLIDLRGTIIHQTSIDALNNESTRIRIPQLSAGLYMIVVELSNGEVLRAMFHSL